MSVTLLRRSERIKIFLGKPKRGLLNPRVTVVSSKPPRLSGDDDVV